MVLSLEVTGMSQNEYRHTPRRGDGSRFDRCEFDGEVWPCRVQWMDANIAARAIEKYFSGASYAHASNVAAVLATHEAAA